MNIKEKWVSWEEFNLLFPGLTPVSPTDFSSIGGLTPGSIPFANATGFLAQDNANLFWDETNVRLGIGTAIPAVAFHISFPAVAVVESRLSAKTRPWRQWECIDGNWGLAIGIHADDGKMHLNYDVPIGTRNTSMIVFDGPNARVGIREDAPAFPVDIGVATRIQSSLQVDTTLGVTGDTTLSKAIITGNAEDGLNLTDTSSQIHFIGAAGEKGICYKDTGGDQRYAMMFPDASDVVHVLNRASNGTVEIHANTAVAGAAGDVLVAEFQDDIINLSVDLAILNQKELRFYEGVNYVGFEAPALIGNTIWVLPDADGGAGEAIVTDGARNLSFASVADEKVKVDVGAVAGYLGAAFNDGVLRTGTSMTYVDGGNFVTLNTIQDIRTSASPTFAGLTITDIFSEDHAVDHNLFLGHLAGTAIQAGGQYNVLLGEKAGTALTTGDYNIMIGYEAGSLDTVEGNNVYIGYRAGKGTGAGAQFNVAIGTNALLDVAHGDYNVAIGAYALQNCTVSTNVGIGYNAGAGISNGVKNFALGCLAALYYNHNDSIMIGYAAGTRAVSGKFIAIGSEAGRGSDAGGCNPSNSVFIGYRAGYAINSTSTILYNVGIGTYALTALTEGDNNVAIGEGAGNTITTGDGNICIGYYAGSTRITNQNNKLYIANTNTATPLIYGEFPNALLKVQATNFNVIGTTNLGDGGVTNYAETKADGEINLHGTARVINGQWIDAQAIKAPQTNPAELISFGVLETPAFQFADAIEVNQENVTFNMRLPYRMDKGVAAFLAIGWSADGISPGNCRWQLEYLFTKLDDDTSAGAQDTVVVTSAASATAHGLVVVQLPAMQVTEATDICVHCRVTRLSADVLDTISDAVELHGVCLNFTVDRLGLAT